MIINIKVDGRIERFVIGYVFVITGNLLLNYFKEEEKKQFLLECFVGKFFF